MSQVSPKTAWWRAITTGRFQLGSLFVFVLACAVAMRAYRSWEQKNWRIPWEPFSGERVENEVIKGRPVLVNFTANWDLSVRYLDRFVINSPTVRQAIRERGVIAFRADWTDGSDEIEEALRKLGVNSIPLVALYAPGRPIDPVMSEGLQPDQLVELINGVAPRDEQDVVPLTITHFGLFGVIGLLVLAWALALTEQRQTQLQL